MKKIELLKELEKRLNEEYKKEENKHKHITYIRELVLKEAKNDGLIKDYRATLNYDYKRIYFGSCAGYDRMFQIIL